MYRFNHPLIALASLCLLASIALLAVTLTHSLAPVGAAPADKAEKGPRKFYLTKNLPDGAHALTACDPGYHMASRWEINDPTYLRYDTELGLTTADSGFGPPSTFIGWIRTGYFNDVSAETGIGNCNAWMSADVADFGTWLALGHQWDLPGSTTPWNSGTLPCNTSAAVWCVQD